MIRLLWWKINMYVCIILFKAFFILCHICQHWTAMHNDFQIFMLKRKFCNIYFDAFSPRMNIHSFLDKCSNSWNGARKTSHASLIMMITPLKAYWFTFNTTCDCNNSQPRFRIYGNRIYGNLWPHLHKGNKSMIDYHASLSMCENDDPSRDWLPPHNSRR